MSSHVPSLLCTMCRGYDSPVDFLKKKKIKVTKNTGNSKILSTIIIICNTNFCSTLKLGIIWTKAFEGQIPSNSIVQILTVKVRRSQLSKRDAALHRIYLSRFNISKFTPVTVVGRKWIVFYRNWIILVDILLFRFLSQIMSDFVGYCQLYFKIGNCGWCVLGYNLVLI